MHTQKRKGGGELARWERLARKAEHMWHAPLSARQLARCTQIRDVQLLRDVIGIDQQLVLIFLIVIRAFGSLSLLLLELSALRAIELGFPWCG